MRPSSNEPERKGSSRAIERAHATGVPQLEIEACTDDERAIVCVAGEIDPATRDQLQARLAEAMAAAPNVVVDLRGVTFMDSTGLAVLLHAHQESIGRGGALVLRDPPPPIQRLLRIAGLADVFTTEVAPHEATASTGPVPRFEVTNTDNGQVIQVRVVEPIDEQGWAALGDRLLTLIEVRQPRELRIAAPGVAPSPAVLDAVRTALVALGGTVVVDTEDG